MKHILFVDDDGMVLEALERMLHGMRKEWQMQFVRTGREALKLMAEHPADVVVSDMRMPGMNGAELLNEILRLYPKTVRLILSGYADTEMTMQCVGGTHQFLSKPCSGDDLREVILRTTEMDRWLDDSPVKALAARMSSLPSMPALYFQILKVLRSPDVSLEEVGETIAQDPAMTAKMLQLVNSAFFGLRQQLSDPTEAVLHLGLETIKSLVLSSHVFFELRSNPVAQQLMDEVYRHSLATAGLAREIARREGLNQQAIDGAFTAGLLHDVGRMVLAANLPDQYAEALARAKNEDVPLWNVERRAFGATHAEVGGYLLSLWGLPVPIIEAVAFHHQPGACANRDFNLLTTVHVADELDDHAERMGESDAPPPGLDLAYLAEVGVRERLPAWLEIFRKQQPALSISHEKDTVGG